MRKKLILASSSPRRKELLTQAGFSFQVLPANADENITETAPAEMVKKLSERKACASMEAWEQQGNLSDSVIVLGADTIVVQENGAESRILQKPADHRQAAEMLRHLQGNTHCVYTGVTLLWLNEKKQLEQITFSEKTDVTFYPMTEAEIREYVASGECDDKAGGYAVQGLAMKYIKKIDGDYHNVVGLPVAAIYQVLRKRSLELEAQNTPCGQ
ncbi:MAG: Maf family protein [Lachnospiraceae bacterium]|nr:Maf family protein [Lachnospiraceae bacterium]